MTRFTMAALLALTTACGSSQTATDAGSTDTSTIDTPTSARPAASVTLTGTIGGTATTAVDIAFEATTSGCGGTAGIQLSTSGAPIACATTLGQALTHPYLRMRLSRRDVGSYTLVADGACTATTTDRVFTASYEAQGASPADGTIGTLQITSTAGRTIWGTFTLTFGTSGAVTGTFTATSCAP